MSCNGLQVAGKISLRHARIDGDLDFTENKEFFTAIVQNRIDITRAQIEHINDNWGQRCWMMSTYELITRSFIIGALTSLLVLSLLRFRLNINTSGKVLLFAAIFCSLFYIRYPFQRVMTIIAPFVLLGTIVTLLKLLS